MPLPLLRPRMGTARGGWFDVSRHLLFSAPYTAIASLASEEEKIIASNITKRMSAPLSQVQHRLAT